MERWQTLTGCVQESQDGLARVQDFLEQVALWSEPEKAAAEEEQEGSPDVVNVMTLHLSKGLEFAVVFIVGKPIQWPFPLSSAVDVFYALCSFAVIDRLLEALSAKHGSDGQQILFCCSFIHLLTGKCRMTSVMQPVRLTQYADCLHVAFSMIHLCFWQAARML